MRRFARARSSTGSRAGSGRIDAARASGARCCGGRSGTRRTCSQRHRNARARPAARSSGSASSSRSRRPRRSPPPQRTTRRIRYGFEMRRRLDEPIPDAPAAGRHRAPTRPRGDHRRIWDADVEAFRDHFEPRDRDDERLRGDVHLPGPRHVAVAGRLGRRRGRRQRHERDLPRGEREDRPGHRLARARLGSTGVARSRGSRRR